MDNIAITLDVDWTPDFVIDRVAELLLAAGTPATWFITHSSPALERLRTHPGLFELGVHPNFMSGSTQGSTPEAVLEHVMALVPEAVSMRTHALVQSTPLFSRVVHQTPLINDVSLFLPYASHLQPALFRVAGSTLTRLPFFWSDVQEMAQPQPAWSLAERWLEKPGLKIFTFHPIHIALNSRRGAAYTALKQRVRRLDQATPQDLDDLVESGPGARQGFLNLLDCLAGEARLQTVRQIAQDWREAQHHQEFMVKD